jgi:O-antigen/teichoic acid export membrane protein
LVGGVAVWKAQWQLDDRWTLILMGLTALPFLGFNGVRSGILAGLNRVVWAQFSEMLIRPLTLVLLASLLFALGLLNSVTALMAFAISAIIAFAVGVVFLKRAFKKGYDSDFVVTTEEARHWRRAWLAFILLVAASKLNAQIGILLLGWLSADDQVAAMQVAEKGAMLVAFSLAVVNLVIGPHITRVYRVGDKQRLQLLSRQSARAALVVALPIALAMIFFGKHILTLALGVEYAEIATTPLMILAIGQLFNVSFGSVGLLLTMSGHEKYTLYGQTSALLINVIVAILLIPNFGAIGAAVSASVGVFVWNLLMAIQVIRKLSVRPSIV